MVSALSLSLHVRGLAATALHSLVLHLPLPGSVLTALTAPLCCSTVIIISFR